MRRLAFALVTFAIASILTAALGELLVRVLIGPPAQLLYTASFRDTQTDFDVVYGVTPEGRRTTCGPAADAGARRVVVVGDSFVFGQGVADCDDFVSLLNLGSHDRRVMNFGIIGTAIGEYRLVVRDLLDDGDEVVIVFYGNDVSGGGAERGVAGRLADHSSALALLRRARRAWLLRRVRESDRDVAGAVAYLDGRPNQILSLLRESPDRVRTMVEPGTAAVESFRDQFAQLAEQLVERFGAEHVWITCVPDAQTVSERIAALVREHGGTVAPYGEPGEAYDLVRDLSRRHGLRFVDVFPGFLEGGDELYHPHDLHWTPAGHRRMAELLAEPLGLPPPASSDATDGEGGPREQGGA